MRLDGKVIVLVGAGGSLGAALAARFTDEGVAGLVLGDLTETSLEATTALLLGSVPIDTRVADVRDAASVDQLIELAIDRYGRVDAVINTAGVLSPNGRIHNTTMDDWHTAIDVNLLGAVNVIRSAVGVMRPQRAGTIVTTASVAGLTAWPYVAPYGVTKAAIVHLTKVAAVEYAVDGIRINCVCPGVFPSAMHADTSAESMRTLTARHPLGLGTPNDVVGAFVYLASDDSTWTTGTALVVDGGYTAP